MASDDPFLGRMKSNWRQRSNEQSTFKDNLRVIPRGLVKLVIALWVLALVFVQLVNALSGPLFPELGTVLSALAGAGLATLGGVVAGVFILFNGYIYADAKRRGMSPVLWVIVAICVPYLIGLIIYFVVREPLPFNCPHCGALATAQFNFCTRCQYNLRPNCPHCRRELRHGDRFCPHCGATIESVAAMGAAEASAAG
jgi:hypothetical protein